MSKEECCMCSDRLNYVKLCEKYDQLESVHEVLVEDNLTYENQIADLEAKLAEKEKERHEEWKTGKEWKWEWQKVNQQLEQANQDKISFAVEQINKIKNDLYENDKINIRVCDFDEIDKIFDNQIKQLKEGK